MIEENIVKIPFSPTPPKKKIHPPNIKGMTFSTTELFKLHLICLSQIKSVSNHKCLD